MVPMYALEAGAVFQVLDREGRPIGRSCSRSLGRWWDGVKERCCWFEENGSARSPGLLAHQNSLLRVQQFQTAIDHHDFPVATSMVDAACSR